MSDLSTEQLTELTTRVNARFAEFDFQFEERRRGEVRLIYDVITEWIERDTPEKWRAWALGYARGVEETMAEYAPPDEADAWEGDRGGHRCFGAVTPKGRAFSINGDPNMSEETAAALGAMMDAVYEKLTQDQTEPLNPNGGHADDDPLGDVYHAGFMRGRKVGRQEAGSAGAPQGPRQVTHSAPIDDPPQSDEKLASVEAEPPALSPTTAAALGPEHTLVTPVKPIGRDRDPRVPEPDVARGKLAQALAAGSNGDLAVATINRPRTLAEADATSDDVTHDEVAAQVRGSQMDAATRASQYREILHELQDMAVEGVMPGTNRWNTTRPNHLPTSSTILLRYDIDSWEELARRAKLQFVGKGAPKHGRKPKATA